MDLLVPLLAITWLLAPWALEVVARAALMALALLMLVWTARPRRRGLDVVAMPLAIVAVIERGGSGRKAAISPQCLGMLGAIAAAMRVGLKRTIQGLRCARSSLS